MNSKMDSTDQETALTASQLFNRFGLEGKLIDNAKAYENLLDYAIVKAPTNFDYVVQHVQHSPLFDSICDNPAFTNLNQFGECRDDIVKTLDGMDYKDFKGVYMGLKPYNSKESDVLPFPLDEEATRHKVYFFARVFDGGQSIDDICSDTKYVIPDPDDDGNHLMFTQAGTYSFIIFSSIFTHLVSCSWRC